MPSYTASTSLTEKEYCQLFVRLSYRQRLYQIITIMGIMLLILSIIRFFIKSLMSENIQLFLFAFSIYGLILFPLLVWLRARKIYRNSTGLKGKINYTFSDTGVSLDASGIASTFAWKDFGKSELTKNYLLLFGYNRAAYFLKRHDLSPEAIAFIQQQIAEKEPLS